ncbi:30S ribosomal protein S10 [Candidatus Karelsulcia muelleri]|uniref:Small ribosomal subunit protein uS10 n=1 Tax=Candidatus Karelsulcia muelleri TaxID=336810 RepID=A0A346E112_9FLAO|nr:30S ribosomal protein S10 [Candidatus Karelsulcia muelleri]AXN02667.1 SSU ribosomal protein S10p (S20e) [Candidatus Karelsulcia muelleri]WDI79598.1 30S ribosomal protein S10 [Candidatus Karelsulcia muelleri]WDR78920.1 30S ribosomal protein S10 [Candidatus Karelsulcia muelleri]
MLNYKIKIKAFDGFVLNISVIQIMNYISKNNIKGNGPIHLPTKKKIYTILRSPHVHKKSREQFKLYIHQRFFFVYNVKYNVLKKIYIPSCVKLEITKIC